MKAAPSRIRRKVVAFLCAAMTTPAVFARPGAGRRLPQVGFLVLNLPLQDYKSGIRGGWAIIKPELRRRGWIEGENVVFHHRSAEGDWTRIPGLVREMVAMPVDVLVTYGIGVEEAARQTRNIPIVGPISWTRKAPIQSNVTGVNDIPSDNIYAKHLSLLKAITPSISLVGIFHDSRDTPFGAHTTPDKAAAAAALGIKLVAVPRKSLAYPDPDLDAARRGGVDALLVASTPGTQFAENQMPVHAWARKWRIPVIYENVSAVKTGGLIAFGPEDDWLHRRLAYFIDRLLRGAKPSELPIEDPTHFELAINLDAARAIGVVVPVALQIEATSLIDSAAKGPKAAPR